ncbi:glycoside hydrolase family 6 protein [Nonomuraea jiangxiensis]|uniref:Serine/threonine protein kinase n=1 Tax=Nonomuraea jiangxiensis TaxID=633440 RepID=A0A1G7YKF3_9ACTN|nr:glycoside hydrolase family 6 protein [Nonomuraea jiangxiensis]SDG97001.1 Serine/threonine protein kinase [Nonomuraea jiangxiensis]
MTLDALRDGDPGQVGPYALLGRLGEGGMGVVYLGRAPDGTRVAVKLIHAGMRADADYRRRFAREVAAAKRVARFCTAPVLDADVEGDRAYLVTEYVEGPSLGQAVRASGPLTGSTLDGLAAAMAMALRAIHGAGVVHRDLKPGNVLLSQVGPKVIDFGIAQLAEGEISSAVVGTPAYMSPEQVSGATIGPASDVFSWGATVAFAAGGVPPFGSSPVPAVLLRILNEQPDLTGLSGPLRDLVLASLAKNPAQRPTAQDLMDHLSTAPQPGDVSFPPAHGPGTTGNDAEPAAAPGPSGPGHADPAGPEHLEPMADTGPGDEPASTAEAGPGRAAARRRGLLAAAAAIVVAVATVTTALVWRNGDAPSQSRPPAARSGTDQGATGTGTPTTALPVSSPQNPLTAAGPVTFYAPKEPNAEGQAKLWDADRAKDAALLHKLAAVPFAIRLSSPDTKEVIDRLTAAREDGGVPVFMINSIPGRDCRPARDAAVQDYLDWIEDQAERIGPNKAVIILEPSGLVNLPGSKNCDEQGSPEGRYKALRQAVSSLKRNNATAVYLDGGHDLGPGIETMAKRLVGAGVEKADGFVVNTAGYQSTDKIVAYGKAVSDCVSVLLEGKAEICPPGQRSDTVKPPHFVVDTSRNGRGSWTPTRKYADPQVWCNPPDRGVGARPTTETGDELVDAYLWIARPGTSSGPCTRGTSGKEDPEYGEAAPAAGQFWPELALERAKNANPPLE